MLSVGQYDEEYRSCPCFWGKQPAKYVKEFVKRNLLSSPGDILDLGAGEGKNAIYLCDTGHRVTAVEVSLFATKNLLDRLVEEEKPRKLAVHLTEAAKFLGDTSQCFDAIVSYGMLHCLTSIQQVEEMLDMMAGHTKSSGIHIVSAFTDERPVPHVQKYLSPTLLPKDFILQKYQGWEVIAYENDIIVESHPTSKEPHEHSLFRLIARRN